jgi:predicted SAM-dependent methyltransferase
MSYNLPFSEGQKIIELGGGQFPRFRPNVDIRKEDTVDLVADFDDPLPLNPNEWHGVFCSYVLEHISYRKIKQFITEVHRILKPGGIAVFITANTEAQMEWVLGQKDWDDRASSILYGDQDYKDNTHKNTLSPKYVFKLLQELGYKDIFVMPWGELGTDMIIEAKKEVTERKNLFDKHYFNGGKKVGGYAREGYWDYPVHNVTFDKVMELKPKSVLEIGSSRGYILKRIQDTGIPVLGLEISKHCYLTRAIKEIVEWDLCKFPWPVKDKAFDLAISCAVLEHIPEEHLPSLIKELSRVSKRGLHGVDFGEHDDGFDKTHCTLKKRTWWEEKMPAKQEVINKEELEQGSLLRHIPAGDDKLKLNIGSFINQFHYGWLNMDIIDLNQFARQNYYKFFARDVREGLPFANKSVDLMYSSHFIEHLTYAEAKAFINECKRVMKENGTVRLLIPDLELLFNKYKSNELGMFDEINDDSASFSTQASKLWTLLFSGHKAAFDFNTIKEMGTEAGFKVEKKSFREGHPQIIKETIDMLPDLSLFVELSQ